MVWSHQREPFPLICTPKQQWKTKKERPLFYYFTRSPELTFPFCRTQLIYIFSHDASRESNKLDLNHISPEQDRTQPMHAAANTADIDFCQHTCSPGSATANNSSFIPERVSSYWLKHHPESVHLSDGLVSHWNVTLKWFFYQYHTASKVTGNIHGLQHVSFLTSNILKVWFWRPSSFCFQFAEH